MATGNVTANELVQGTMIINWKTRGGTQQTTKENKASWASTKRVEEI